MSEASASSDNAASPVADNESIYVATQWQLMWWRFQRHYLAMTSTPIGPAQVVAGHLVWTTIKIGGCGAVYVAVLALFGGVHWFGVPGGIGGVALAGFLGGLLAKSIVETRGIG